MNKRILILTILSIVLISGSQVSQMLIVSAQTAEDPNGEVPNEFKPVWNSDVNTTAYFFDLSSVGGQLFSIDNPDGLVKHKLEQLEYEFEKSALRDVNVFVNERGIGVNFITHWTTNPDAYSFEEYRNDYYSHDPGRISLSQSANNSRNVYDILPDVTAHEKRSRSPTQINGLQTDGYENETDISTTGTLLVDFTNYNHSTYDFLRIEDLKLAGAGNAIIKIEYSTEAGVSNENVTILDTDYYISEEDVFIPLPHPSLSTSTYVDSISFTNLEADSFKFFRFSQASEVLDERRGGEIFNLTRSSTLNGLSQNSFLETVTKIQSKPDFYGFVSVEDSSATTANAANGFLDMQESLLNAISKALNVKKTDIIDHEVHSSRDRVTIPQALTKALYSGVIDAYERGETALQPLVRAMRQQLRSVNLAVGLTATADDAIGLSGLGLSGLGDWFSAGWEKTKSLASSTWNSVKDSATNEGGLLNGLGEWGSGLIQEGANQLGQLPSKAAGILSYINPVNYIEKGGKSLLMYVAIVLIALLVIGIVVRRILM